eukprot:m.28061 g.28061  ORF g.28061 m.28061 type:complete len:95 (+) comp30546_c0_seq2:511-795(+)
MHRYVSGRRHQKRMCLRGLLHLRRWLKIAFHAFKFGHRLFLVENVTFSRISVAAVCRDCHFMFPRLVASVATIFREGLVAYLTLELEVGIIPMH